MVLIGGLVVLGGVIIAAGTEMLSVDGFINKMWGWGSYKSVAPAADEA